MKILYSLMGLLALTLCLLALKPASRNLNTINPVIGDASYMAKYARQPDGMVSEKDRIQTHLLYAEALIRSKETRNMSAAVKEKRNHLLNLLHEYIVAGRFPINEDHSETRKPCFIDRKGAICAVGYLVEQTAGREAAEAISRQHQYETIAEMQNDAVLKQWVSESGLTLEECATIQPTYGPVPSPDPGSQRNDQYITKSYGVSTGISAGCNIAFNAINQYQVKNGSRSKLVPILGLATGAFSIFNGIRHYPKQPAAGNWGYYEASNDTKKLLSVGNIGLGAVTMALSTWNLVKNRKPAAKKISWSPYSLPQQNGKMAYGLSFSRKLG
jgi:hypothetical protein